MVCWAICNKKRRQLVGHQGSAGAVESREAVNNGELERNSEAIEVVRPMFNMIIRERVN